MTPGSYSVKPPAMLSMIPKLARKRRRCAGAKRLKNPLTIRRQVFAATKGNFENWKLAVAENRIIRP
jgi:hypothetical protein